MSRGGESESPASLLFNRNIFRGAAFGEGKDDQGHQSKAKGELIEFGKRDVAIIAEDPGCHAQGGQNR